VLCWGWPSCNL